MSTLTHPASNLRQLWLSSLSASQRPLLWIGLATGFLVAPAIAAFMVLDTEGAFWVAEMLPPLLAAICAARLAAEHETSGFNALLASSPQARTGVLWLRALSSLAYGLGFGLLGVLVTGITSPGGVALGGWLSAIPSAWFLALLASLAATYFGSAWTGVAVACVPWAASLVWGYSHSPLLSLKIMRAVNDTESFFQFWPVNRLALLALGAGLWLLHGVLHPASVRGRLPASPARLAALAAGFVGVYWAAGIAFSLFVGSALLLTGQWFSPLDLGKQLERYRPVPAAALFGPAFAAYTGNGLSLEQQQAHNSRITQLIGALDRWPHSVWGPAIRHELGREAEAWFPHSHTPANLASTSEGVDGLNPLSLAALLDPRLDPVTDEVRARVAVHLAREYPRTAEGAAAAEYLLDNGTPLPYDDALTLALSGVKPPGEVKQPLWLLHLAQVLLEHERYPVARSLVLEARALARRLAAGEVRTRATLEATQREELRQAEVSAGQLLPLTLEPRVRHGHTHRH